MKKPGGFLIILSLTIIFSACPPLLEDNVGDYGEIVTFKDPFELDVYKWFEILDQIAKDGKFVSLDLSKAILKDDNKGGGLIKLEAGDPFNPFSSLTAIAFDPFPASSSGKDFILSIILPDTAQIIKGAVKLNVDIDSSNKEKIEEAKKYSAFRSFSRLRSVKANNVACIGNFAFADCKALTDINFPRVSNTSASAYADIGKYAFLGCTDIKEIKFNTAAVIGEYAFKGCTSLSKIDFPEVDKIEKNAFEGCTSLVNVFFEKATKICDEAFKGCTGLKKAEFNTKQERKSGSGTPVLPPDANPNFSLFPDFVIFYPSVFNGCKALEVLNVRNAWNVYFAKDALANAGSAIEIYLLDVQNSDPKSFGHPQNVKFLGEGVNNTIKKVNIIVPVLEPPENTKIFGNNSPDNIAAYLKANYSPGVAVNIQQK